MEQVGGLRTAVLTEREEVPSVRAFFTQTVLSGRDCTRFPGLS